VEIEQSIMDVAMDNHDVIEVIVDEAKHLVVQQVHQQ
jgi:hypothetical protein